MGRIQHKGVLNTKSNKSKSIQKTRKQLRKEKRQQKKISRAVYYQKKKSKNQSEQILEISRVNNDKLMKKKEKNNTEQVPSKQKRQKPKDAKEERMQKNVKKQRVTQLKQANLDEDKAIKQLEKQLKLNKRKSKSIPKSFVSDGLDYLLDFCNSENRSHIVETEKQLLETGLSKEFEEDLNMAIGEDDTEDGNEKHEQDSVDDNEDSEQNSENESLLSDENVIQVDSREISLKETNTINIKSKKYVPNEEEETVNEESSLSNTSEQSDGEISSEETDTINIKSKKYAPNEEEETINEESSHSNTSDDNEDLWEDIYGRQRDKKGNIVLKKYVPPAVRIASNNISSDSEKINRLKKQMKGILNRLAEQNMHTIANQVEEMYMSNSRNCMNVMLSTLMMESIVAPILTPDRLICEHMMLIAILHANVGTEVGAHFLLTIVKKLHHMLEESHCVENKELDNIILIISHLYNFKVYGHRLLYEILEKLAAKFTEKEIELILLILRTVGFQLRKDDPIALKELILNLQQKANNAILENSRVKFMLDVLLAIKNNNMSKIPQYDPSWIEHLKKILKSFIHKGNSVTQFNVTLEDLLEADERGKWWIVGSAWSGLKDIGKLEKNLEDKKQKYSEDILELARKQRMNTDVRRDIFCILITAEDYLDAFEKIHHLGLKNQQQREVIYVILNCCIQEKKFNPYYAVLAQRLCDSDRKYQLTIQYALWDKLKTLDDLNTKQLTNVAKFLTLLFLGKGLPLSVLKVIQFTELDKLTMRLVRQIMLGILLHENEEACLEVFGKISLSPKLQTFRESLRLFINHFLVKNVCAAENLQEHSKLLKKRAGLIDKLLSTRESKFIF
ncbi:Nucleolar MIF4G domain-containing protein 1 [Trachymyrmex septentrionalis]|uniref:Nucleolar MIF4G domain-containing protein 1 n=1 Tax=Trachymyrmex septentrionalis TaxID=34720 RepID=A0A195EXN0_9HYME|nr:PREDICTED: nucleolar MIF4G domain-containing protein 1 [Trachymyrmex septentrionalis]KYN32983.1 Nucleolar MIF4G domain-containing protein 1 [Trachymyrmex septentrionalis]